MNFERVFKKVVISLLVLAFLPTIVQLIVHLVHEVISPPALVHSSPPVHNGGFGAGVLVTVIVLLLVVGLLTRIGRALRNPEATRYRTALDRRARTLPRFSAEADEVPIHGTGTIPADPDPELPWE